MKLSKNFSRAEFACQCGCGQDTVDALLVKVLQDLRDHFGKPVRITSANRCSLHNTAVGGSANSQHLLSRAADVQIEGVEPSLVQEYLLEKYADDFGIGCYDNFTHVDTREIKARWRG